jgi:hypothetical protein
MSPARQHADGHSCKSTTKATTSARDEKTSPYPTAQRVIAVILGGRQCVTRGTWTSMGAMYEADNRELYRTMDSTTL